MSDDIQCAIDGCMIDAEIEVVRKGAVLWICGKHHRIFIAPNKRSAELEELLERQHIHYCESVRTALRRVGVERPNTECHGPLVADLCTVARDAKARAEKAEAELAGIRYTFSEEGAEWTGREQRIADMVHRLFNKFCRVKSQNAKLLP